MSSRLKQFWFGPRIVQWIDGCEVLSIEMTLPFGATPERSNVADWLRQEHPAPTDLMLDHFSWSLLSQAATSEGTQCRILLVIPPSGDRAQLLTQLGADILLPIEFKGLAYAESYADQHGGDFACSMIQGDFHHILLYQNGTLSQWISDRFPPQMNPEQWIVLRKSQVMRSINMDDQIASIPWLSLDSNISETAIQLFLKMNWVASMNLRSADQVLNMDILRTKRQTLRNSLVALGMSAVFILAMYLHQQNKNAEFAAFQEKNQQSIEIANAKKVAQHALKSQLELMLQNPAQWRTPLQLSRILSEIHLKLPLESQINMLEARAEDRVWKITIQANVANWDSAQTFQERLQQWPLLKSTRLINKRLVSTQDRIEVHMELAL